MVERVASSLVETHKCSFIISFELHIFLDVTYFNLHLSLSTSIQIISTSVELCISKDLRTQKYNLMNIISDQQQMNVKIQMYQTFIIKYLIRLKKKQKTTASMVKSLLNAGQTPQNFNFPNPNPSLTGPPNLKTKPSLTAVFTVPSQLKSPCESQTYQ